ncbi:MAG: efflux RND transporter periplasmic adaptor subunit [Acidobacteria bacterium]|nr:efflux RND transporter periplasmic adaptor subunit [Acidobacteriota bacterium]
MGIKHGCILASIALASFSGCRRQQAPAAATAQTAPVKTSIVQIAPEPFTATVPITGSLISTTRVDVKAETVGRVVRFDKEEGDRVAAGEVVVWVEEENYRLALQQAESAVQVSEAALGKARILQAHSRSEQERAQNLLRSGGITDKDLKSAQLSEQDARAQVALADAQLQQARATVQVARKRLRDCQILAPVSGVMQKKFVNKGAYVEAPTALFTIVDNTKLELQSPVATADLGPVGRGQAVVFTVNSFPGVVFEGAVEEISPAVETDSRAAKVRVRVNNSGGRLRAGMFAQGEIRTGVQSQAVVIPLSAVYRDDRAAKDSYVFVAENGKATRRNVRIGRERDSKLEILAGLKPGDLLLTEQSIELAEGVRVEAR